MQSRRGGKRQRKVNVRKPGFPRILILTEGVSTEVVYFESVKQVIDEKFQDQLIVSKVDLEVKGQGRSTQRLVEIAEKMKSKSDYQEVWLVFDKDQFADFDKAIQNADRKGMQVAWSNPSFELWFLMHHETITAPLDNKQIVRKLAKFHPDYKKSSSIQVHEIIDYVEAAIKRGKDTDERNKIERISKPSEMNPQSKVYLLVERLLEYLK